MSRRRRLRLARTVVVLIALAVGIHMLTSGGATRSTANPAARQASSSKAAPTPSPSPRTVVTNPFTQPKVQAYLAKHPGMSATVHDLATGKVWSYRPQAHDTMASIMKVDILETELYEHGVLHGEDLENATGMVENSSNDDAQDLWDAEGGAVAVSAYNRRVGLTGTTPNAQGFWGLSTTTAADQVTLLDHLAQPNPLLSPAERHQALRLMHTVELDQRWGVSAGLPHGTQVAIKNGWLPLDHSPGWEVNSDGIVTGNGYHDDVSVLTTGARTEAVGIKWIQGLTRLMWPLMRLSI
jgi:Beta-lactamase enzyme family